ncbi:hypothetical protein GCM10022286_23560 [Gryllotalpicola daejeonensis]|uniref:Uncharacterized protein n=1 Tax=Gryllotalpicola daejeonensis TaxID=993087 RepID=A0ABP7ZLN2_9MICO
MPAAHPASTAARQSTSILYIALILAATGLAMLPAYRIVVFTIADQAAEYSKASVAYGPNVPADVEGGSPLFIVVSLLPMVGLFAAGIVLAIVVARRRRVTVPAAAITIVILAAAIAAIYIGVQLATGPNWPPSNLVRQ